MVRAMESNAMLTPLVLRRHQRNVVSACANGRATDKLVKVKKMNVVLLISMSRIVRPSPVLMMMMMIMMIGSQLYHCHQHHSFLVEKALFICIESS